ncbi:CPBP family intramembrane metalloprotease [Nocardioides sp. zg-ZUI104]|uniref:CPBP family intramembrane glutamic endopeptidase n=1 Tax=Nocardioides faecalis TaxID=2803858 RepID=UPI001BCBFD0A|nr:type II CAAX endopeptidase family protein [Nocardioides faecalis]MBS4751388.1 CPBP family intramembrane metalloprotease [Nocardioides faecalis]
MDAGLRYDQLQRLGPRAPWRPLLGVLMLGALVFGAQLVLSVLVGVVLFLTGTPLDEVGDELLGDPVTPAFLALVNLGWAVAIPAVWLVGLALHRQRPGWLASVAGRIRWRWLLACLGLSVLALLLTLGVAALLPVEATEGMETDTGLNAWSSTVRDFVLVVLLLTPLQAAGEEYVFRGYLTQAFGGLFGRWGDRLGAVVAVVVPALLFALAHGLGQDLPVFFDRFAFGLVAGTLVLLTGGLEAGIAMHVLNNFLAFGVALAFGDMTAALNPTGGSWWTIVSTLTQSVGYLLLALWGARRMGVLDRTTRSGGGAILEPRQRPV